MKLSYIYDLNEVINYFMIMKFLSIYKVMFFLKKIF